VANAMAAFWPADREVGGRGRGTEPSEKALLMAYSAVCGTAGNGGMFVLGQDAIKKDR